MNEEMKLYILANPKAGSHTADDVIAFITATYPQIQLQVHYTVGIDDEYRQIEEIVENFVIEQDKLLILGGDGTLSKSLKYLPVTIPFAYYPTGSGNDFARSMGIDRIEQIIEALLSDRIQSITVLASNLGVVVNSLDMGYSAQVVAYSANSTVKKWLNRIKLGKLTYLFFGIRSLLSRAKLTVRLTINGQEQILKDLFFLSVANNTYFGGGIMIWPEASAYKEQIDIVWFQRGNLFQRIQALLALLLKKHQQSPLLHHTCAQAVTIEAEQELTVQMDGELCQAKEITLSCQERQIYL